MTQPKTSATLTPAEFRSMKQTLHNRSAASRGRMLDRSFAFDLPRDIGIKLNNGCNLRCKHCFEWNPDGYHHEFERQEARREIDFALLERIFVETRPFRSRMYLWGGEPLMYSKFDELCELLASDPRISTICTNAVLVEPKLESLLKLPEGVTLLASLEGFEAENDAIRGRGIFRKVMSAIELLLERKRAGEFRGDVSVSLTINDAMVTRLYDFMEFFEEVGVNSVYFVFPWYIPEEVAERMDTYFAEHFGWLEAARQDPESITKSWHSFTYHLSPDNIEPLLAEMEKLRSRVWKNRIRFQPALEPDEVRSFVLGTDRPGMGRTECLALSTRMDVLPNGKVNPCKFFPEFTIADLRDGSLKDVFHGDGYKKHREALACGLTPVCSKCVLLYNNGA
ncbi:radical SAM protein [Paenibacillus dendritiformis]|uniref:radical SAM protein n=1 Tax=Paenibacillus dendritiformis TaxID=130049 RepID=UPI0020C2404D|nr:radical SAM protein [Paenibacillus dendritiformis]CAH8768946.1 radical SAM protein [Paenibacillus dendritiformis]